MRLITEIPVSKTHAIPWCSWGSLCLLALFLITILIPFFLVFMEGFFKNTTESYEKFSISSTNQYYISATTSAGSSLTSTNLGSQNVFNSALFISNIKLSEQDVDSDYKNDKFTFQATIKLPGAAAITNVMVLLFFNAQSSYLNTTAMTVYNFYGSRISSAVSTGYLQLAQNSVVNTSLPNTNTSSNPFVENYYDLPLALQSYYQQPVFFKKVTNDLISNQNSPEATIRIQLNLNKEQRAVIKPGVFEQIQWSWCYYFSVAFVVGYFFVCLVDVLLKYGVIESRIRRY